VKDYRCHDDSDAPVQLIRNDLERRSPALVQIAAAVALVVVVAATVAVATTKDTELAGGLEGDEAIQSILIKWIKKIFASRLLSIDQRAILKCPTVLFTVTCQSLKILYIIYILIYFVLHSPLKC